MPKTRLDEPPKRFEIVCKQCRSSAMVVWRIEDREVILKCNNCGAEETC